MKIINKAHYSQNRISESPGFVLPFCSFLLVIFFAMASFVIDIGHARYQQRTIQVVADACSAAALIPLGVSANYNAVRNEVYDIAARNGVSNSEVSAINCGTWSAGSFTSQGVDGSGNPICNSTTNAVKVTISRQIATFFGKVLNTPFITPQTRAIATRILVNQCTRPFGINQAMINALAVGQTEFVVDRSSPGNWGKLATSGGFSMISDACNSEFHIGGHPDTDTGFSGVQNAFQAIKGTPDANGIVVALTSPFPSGGSAPVEIYEFAKVDFLNSGGNGNNWWARFRIVQRNVLPNPDVNVSERKVVL